MKIVTEQSLTGTNSKKRGGVRNSAGLASSRAHDQRSNRVEGGKKTYERQELPLSRGRGDSRTGTIIGGSLRIKEIRGHKKRLKVPAKTSVSLADFIISTSESSPSSDNEEIDQAASHKEQAIEEDEQELEKVTPTSKALKKSTKEVFPKLPLTHLSLSHNHIVKIDECAFQNMTNLTELDLSFNQLTSSLLSEDIFKILDLSYNGLKFFPDTLLHTPRRLTTLLLEGNQLTTVPKGLSASHKLEHLTLSGNPIEVINVENGFPRLEFLKSLQLSYMDKLTRIEAGGLAKLTALEEFHCNHNPKLKFIDPTAFSRREEGEESEQWPPLTKGNDLERYFPLDNGAYLRGAGPC
uniref:Uncharacterized protein n=1 Tax=Timema shepardi TaxID=629360 RepID=A0A7R9G531_TIMSH|nr:unnamed protein product [Timema shepardi]